MGNRRMASQNIRSTLQAVLAAGALSVVLTGCNTFGLAGAFGETPAALPVTPEVQFLPSDQALALAKTHFGQADYGYSANLYQRVVDLNPKDPEGYFGLAASYDRLGRFDLSDRVYAQLYRMVGGTVQYYNNIGYSYVLRGNRAAAQASFAKAAQLEPDNAVVADNLQLLNSGAGAADR